MNNINEIKEETGQESRLSKYVQAMNAILESHSVNTIDLVRIVGSFEEIDRMVDFGYISHDEKWRWHVTDSGMTAIGGMQNE